MYRDYLMREGTYWQGPLGGFLQNHHGAIFGLVGVFMLFAVWSLVWKGLALWRAAQRGDTAWFVVLLVVNTLGILEILYLYVFSKKSSREGNSSS